MFKELLNKCITGDVLTEQEACSMMDTIMQGRATSSQIASLLSILRFRGETVDEMTGFTKSMRAHMTTLSYEYDVIDTCGTGGDGASTFNISTASAIVASALGVKVAKHGNRAVSSKSGSADVLEELGIDIQETQEDAAIALNQHGMSFLFAPLYHKAMKHAVTPRKEIGFRTVFNLLGPLANPARSKRQVIGVFSTEYAEKMAYTLRNLGSEHVLFVTGRDGLDECSVSTATDVVELKNGEITRYVLEPEDVGLVKGHPDEIKVSTVKESATLIEAIFLNRANPSARNIVLFNSGVALYVGGRVKSISEGIELAKIAIEDGIVSNHFENLRTRKVKDYVN
jgi:anthranilate phosphoribosyltransferase